MDLKPDFPRPLQSFLIIIASFIFVFMATQVLVFIFVPDVENLNQSSMAMKMLMSFGEVGLIIIPMIYIRNRNLSVRKAFRWKSIPMPIFFWSIIIGLSITILGDELDRLVNMIFPAPELLGQISEVFRITSVPDFFLLVFGVVIAAAFVEESIIRGFLQKSLEKYQDVTHAVIYASLAWTIIHGMIFWAIQIFLLGIVLGLLAWRSDSIFPSVIGHGINNAAALFFYNINQDKLDKIYLWGDHVSPVFLILAAAGLIYGVKAFYRYYPILLEPVADYDSSS